MLDNGGLQEFLLQELSDFNRRDVQAGSSGCILLLSRAITSEEDTEKITTQNGCLST